MSELVTFVTRTCNRPAFLEKNQESLRAQTDGDWHQVLLVGDVGRGLHYANGMLAQHKAKVKGQYVYILDDDNRLIIDDFVSGLREIIEKSDPHVIMVKSQLSRHGIMPRGWGKNPRLCQVDTTNFVVKKKLWKAHIKAFHQPRYGDFYFIQEIFNQPRIKVMWWDKVVAKDMR